MHILYKNKNIKNRLAQNIAINGAIPNRLKENY